MRLQQPVAPHECSICHVSDVRLNRHLEGFVCESCSEKTRQGADATSQTLRLQQSANTALVQQLKGEHAWLDPVEREYHVAANALKVLW